MPLYVMLLMALAVDAAKNLDNQSFLKRKKRKKKGIRNTEIWFIIWSQYNQAISLCNSFLYLSKGKVAVD